MGAHWRSLTYVFHDDLLFTFESIENGWHVIIFYIRQLWCIFSQDTNDISLKRFSCSNDFPKKILWHLHHVPYWCHGHSTKMELAKLKATHSNRCKGTISPCQSTQWWINVLFMYSYGWVDILILVVWKFLGFVALIFMVCWFQLS
jgi:hypothetical protein